MEKRKTEKEKGKKRQTITILHHHHHHHSHVTTVAPFGSTLIELDASGGASGITDAVWDSETNENLTIDSFSGGLSTHIFFCVAFSFLQRKRKLILRNCF